MNEQEQQQIAEDKLLHVIQLILPLARGYANTHQVGSNQDYIKYAEEIYNYYADIENKECPECGVELVHRKGHSHSYE
jgi:hypothetical protein